MLKTKLMLIMSTFFVFLFTCFIALSCPICKQEKLRYGDFPVEEKCIDIGEYELYTQIMGNQGPSVVFEAGLGDSSWSWDKVTPQISKSMRTFTYDRMGLGRSQNKSPPYTSRTAQDAIHDLRILLAKAHIKPPYILVGHSLGGLYMQLFAQKYPKEVKAVVLVDSATADQKDFKLPPEDDNYYWEAKGMQESTEQVKKASHFPAVPLWILTSGQRGKEWVKTQEQLTKLSPQSRQIITNESGHFIQREQPDLIIKVLQDVMVPGVKPSQG